MKFNKLILGIGIGIGLIIAFLIYVKIVESHTSLLNCEEVNLHEKEYDLINSLCNNIKDSTIKTNCSVQVINNKYSLVDNINKWQHSFNDDYFDIIPKDINSNYILIYCSRSGIMAGYKLFGIRHHDIFLFNRSNGKIEKRIQIDNGLDCGLIYSNYIYIRFYDPIQVYKCKI